MTRVEHLRRLLSALPGDAHVRIVPAVTGWETPDAEDIESISTVVEPSGSMTVFLNGGGY